MRRGAPHRDRLCDAAAGNCTSGRIGVASRFGGEGAVLHAVRFSFSGGIDDELRVDDHAAMFGSFWRNALGGKCWAENGNQGRCNIGAEGCAYCEGARVGHPVP
jgi:hypothetical protein